MHNRYKLPFFVVCTPILIGALAWAVATHQWIWVALFAIALMLALAAIWTIRAGRNPWWLRSRLDPQPPVDRN